MIFQGIMHSNSHNLHSIIPFLHSDRNHNKNSKKLTAVDRYDSSHGYGGSSLWAMKTSGYCSKQRKESWVCKNLMIHCSSICGCSQASCVGIPSASSSAQRRKPIESEEEFDMVLDQAQQSGELIIFLWMAKWCRNCIYLKPKLEKLVPVYHPRIVFYAVDVNKVPQGLVDRAGVVRMPTIQLWKDGKKQEEVIGGHKSELVINDICEMIENAC